jgi:hypothetical protein
MEVIGGQGVAVLITLSDVSDIFYRAALLGGGRMTVSLECLSGGFVCVGVVGCSPQINHDRARFCGDQNAIGAKMTKELGYVKEVGKRFVEPRRTLATQVLMTLPLTAGRKCISRTAVSKWFGLLWST